MEFDLQVRSTVYGYFAEEAAAPTVHDVGALVHAPADEVGAAYQRLYAKRMLVLMPDGKSIRMAPPFSGIETQHRVLAKRKTYFANCAWDSFGIPAALQVEADVHSRCEQSNEPLQLHLTRAGPPSSDWLFHTAVPAAHWWRDIVYT